MHRSLRLSLLALLAIFFMGVIFWGASQVAEQDSLKILVEKFGVFGIFLISLITNLNLLVPLHGATFAPVFIAAGFSIPIIILMIAIGTTCADLISYVLGHFGKTSLKNKYPKTHSKIDYFLHNRKKWVLPGIFFYSAFIPFPNELVMLPLGLMGYRLRKILIPLLLGTAVNTTIFTLGFASVFTLLFQ